MLDISDIGLQLLQSNLSPFLKTGITLAVFREGNFPVLKDKLLRSASGLLSGFANVLNTLVGMLLGTGALLFLSVLISDSASSGVVGFVKKVFSKGCLR